MKEQNKESSVPVQMEFTVASITEGIEYWLNNVFLREAIVVDEIKWDTRTSKFSVSITNGIQVGKKLEGYKMKDQNEQCNPGYSGSFQQLMRFYVVETIEDLIHEQEKHIVRLQTKLKPIKKSLKPLNYRQG